MLMLCYPQHIAIYFAVTSFIVNVLCKCSNIARPRSGKPDGEQERRGAQKTGNRNKREYPASYSGCSLFTSQPIEVRGKGLLSGWEKSFYLLPTMRSYLIRFRSNMVLIPNISNNLQRITQMRK